VKYHDLRIHGSLTSLEFVPFAGVGVAFGLVGTRLMVTCHKGNAQQLHLTISENTLILACYRKVSSSRRLNTLHCFLWPRPSLNQAMEKVSAIPLAWRTDEQILQIEQSVLFQETSNYCSPSSLISV